MENKISYFRNKTAMTQEELARKVAVTRQTIISLEQSRYNPSLFLAYKITKALGQKSIEEVFILK
jgi:putative transcriptional regulator